MFRHEQLSCVTNGCTVLYLLKTEKLIIANSIPDESMTIPAPSTKNMTSNPKSKTVVHTHRIPYDQTTHR